MNAEQAGYLTATIGFPIALGLATALLIRRSAKTLPTPEAAKRRRIVGIFAGLLITLVLFAGTLTSTSQAVLQNLEEANAIEHTAFVNGTVEACIEACPAEGRDAPTCEITCTCVGEEMADRISPNDLRAIYLAEQKSNREEAMAPYRETILAGYEVCGFFAK